MPQQKHKLGNLRFSPESELLIVTKFLGPYSAVVVFALRVAGELGRLWIVDVTIQEWHQVLHQPAVNHVFAYKLHDGKSGWDTSGFRGKKHSALSMPIMPDIVRPYRMQLTTTGGGMTSQGSRAHRCASTKPVQWRSFAPVAGSMMRMAGSAVRR